MHDFLSPRYGCVLSCVYKLNLVDLMMTMMLVTLHFIDDNDDVNDDVCYCNGIGDGDDDYDVMMVVLVVGQKFFVGRLYGCLIAT